MDLFSLFKNSSLEVLFSKRLLVAIYSLLSLAVLSQMASATWQFGQGYFVLHQFDTPAAAFEFITLILFLPLWGVGALMLRASVQRFRLAWWVHRAITIAAYQTPLAPAEASFLSAYEYTRREFVSTLLALHYRQVIRLNIPAGGHEVTVTPGPQANTQLTAYEAALLQSVTTSQPSYFSFADPRLDEAAASAHNVLVDNLTARGIIQKEHLPGKSLRQVFRIAYFIAGAVGVLSALALIFQRQQTLAIGYPRYPTSLSELIFLLLVELLVIGIICSAWWPRFVRDYKDPRYEAWIDAAGFGLYLRTVYRDRLSARNIASEDMQTLVTVSPYAVAYGIIPDTTDSLSAVLSVTGQSPSAAATPSETAFATQ